MVNDLVHALAMLDMGRGERREFYWDIRKEQLQ